MLGHVVSRRLMLAAQAFLCCCLAVVPRANAQLVITPTTTLSGETANNTSAASSFAGLENDTPRAANTAKSAMATLIYSGNTTKFYAHFMGWFGSGKHINVGYLSTSSSQVHKQVSDMKSRGFSGAILDWYGSGSYSDTVAGLLRTESEAQGFKFAITEDVGSISPYAAQHICDGTQKLINDLNYAASTYYGSSAYLRINGRPVVFFFGVDAYFIDWNRVRSQASGNPLFIFRNSGGITSPNSDGGFSWQTTNMSDPYDMSLPYLDNYYSTAINNPSRISYGSNYPGFNDSVAGWTGNRFQHRQCGQTWLKTAAEANKYYNTSRQMPYLQVVTWNDYEEGTAIEPGIDNCLDTFAYMSGSTLYWSLDGIGNPNTIAYYRIFISTDGTNLMKLRDVSASSRSTSLSGIGLSSSTTYTLYVKAVGKSSIQNSMSAAVTYRPGDAPPLVKLAVAPTSGTVPLSVTASVSGSTDSNGISSSKIDFGDGTVVAGPTATHTYNTFGKYKVAGRVYDKLGVVGVARVTVNAKPPNTGVTVVAPSSGSSVPNYTRFAAYAYSSNTITSMTLYINGKGMYRINSDRFNIHLELFDGDYTATINAWDSTGVLFQKKVSFHVGTTFDYPPNPVATFSTLTPGVGVTVRGCSGLSTDSDGISQSKTNYGDGSAVQYGTTTYHKYSSTGNYTVTTTVTDGRGKSASTTTTISVQ